MGKLEGKVALVTGSGRNIGRATVLKLAGEGAHVVVNARSNRQEAEAVAREARDLGVKALPVLADIGNKAEVEALADKALSEFGRVDILINNAAIRPHKPFTETRVNVVSPGSIDTRRDHPEWYQGRVPEAAGVPLGRQGSVDEIAATCLFLVSEGMAASSPARRSMSMAARTIADLGSTLS
jgi:NAD(P)-dependent dehydrogenase (short-subunit alcohol dehydrogenase family)